MLLCAGTAARREALSGRARQLADAIDWAALAETLRRHRLLATLGPRVLELEGEDVSSDFALAVAQEIAQTSREGVLLTLVATQISEALTACGIRSAVLKGPPLGEAVYGAPGRRSCSDVDLLVPAEQLPGAVAAVQGLGYEWPRDPVGENGLPLLHFAMAHAQRTLPTVELHWRIHWYEERFAREQLLATCIEAPHGWRPAPAADLAALLLFYARDGFTGLRLASDLSAWWDAFGCGVRPGELDRLLESYPTLRHAVRSAARVAESVVGLPGARVLRPGPAGVRERTAARLAKPDPRLASAQLYAEVGLVDLLLAPRRGVFEAFRRQVLPSEWTFSAAGHGARVLARYGLAVARLARSRRRSRRSRDTCSSP
jgi:hypothetical protein